MNLIFLLWTAHVAILPIYIFRSGNIQPSHMVFLLAFASLPFALKGRGISARTTSTPTYSSGMVLRYGRIATQIFIAFAVYVALLGAVWSMMLGSFVPSLYSSFQVYNALMLIVIYQLIAEDFIRFMKMTRFGIIAALILIVANIATTGAGSAARENGLFNNPNQLSYFCLSANLIFYVSVKLKIGRLSVNWGMSLLSLMICTLTLSRAGLYTCAFVFLLAICSEVKNLGRFAALIPMALVLVLGVASTGLLEKLDKRNNQRYQGINNQIDGRGYDRMLDNPELMILGAGEGENKRFGGALASGGAEIHSSIGILLFCYGIIGLALYVAVWVIMLFAAEGIVHKLCGLALISYGLTHNGLRFSAAMIATMVLIYGGLEMRARSAQQQQRRREISRMTNAEAVQY